MSGRPPQIGLLPAARDALRLQKHHVGPRAGGRPGEDFRELRQTRAGARALRVRYEDQCGPILRVREGAGRGPLLVCSRARPRTIVVGPQCPQAAADRPAPDESDREKKSAPARFHQTSTCNSNARMMSLSTNAISCLFTVTYGLRCEVCSEMRRVARVRERHTLRRNRTHVELNTCRESV